MRRVLLLAMAVALALALLGPQTLLAAESERARITSERKAMADRFAVEERACTSRFAVTACVDDVRARRREALAPLRAQELTLDEAERQQRARERRDAIAARQAQAALRPPAPPPTETRVRQPALPASSGARAPKAQDDGQARAAEAAQRASEARVRQTEIRAAQQRVERRLAEREAQGKKSMPLPVPPAASATR